METDGVLEGNNEKNVCRLEVTVNSYFSVQEGKKVYNRGRTVNWIVDPEEYALFDLEKDINGENFTWDINRKATFWVIENGDLQCKLASDAQLLHLLRSSDGVKLLMIVGRHEETEEMVPSATHEEEMLADMDKRPEWREQPEYGQTTAGPPMAEEEEKEHFMTIGCDPDGDEPTAVDEEWRYFKLVDDDVQPMEVESVQPVVQKRKRARPFSDFDTEIVPDDDVGLMDDNVVPCTTHDKKNPVIKEGDTLSSS
ncbi:unnamed protein product [Urochloa humidicola]